MLKIVTFVHGKLRARRDAGEPCGGAATPMQLGEPAKLVMRKWENNSATKPAALIVRRAARRALADVFGVHTKQKRLILVRCTVNKQTAQLIITPLKWNIGTVGHKSHDPCFHKKYMEAGVMTFVAHCTVFRGRPHIVHETECNDLRLLKEWNGNVFK